MSQRVITLRKTFVAAALAAAASFAHAGSFQCISGSASDCALATSTLSWTWDGSFFDIANNGSGYVSEVYFDLSAGMSASFVGGTGTVNFVAGAQPPALPDGLSVGFVSDIGFDSDGAGKPVNGINFGETARFQITGAALDSFDTDMLAAGLHVRSLVTSSASVITAAPVPAVPEPETYALMLAGLGVVGFMARRRRTA